MAKADKKQNQLEAWTLDNLSRIAVLSSEDVKAMLPHLMSIPSEYEVYDYLTSLLGDDGPTSKFINEFVTRRFKATENRQESKSTESSSKARRQAAKSAPNKKEKESNGGKKGKKQTDIRQLEREFGGGGGTFYRKSEQEIYFKATSKPDTRSKNDSTKQAEDKKVAQTEIHMITSQTDNDTGNGGNNKSKQRKKHGEKSTEKKSKKNRKICYCVARKHGLFTNCLKCGKVICNAEGPGPCTFCGNLVESPQQQLEMLARERRERQSMQRRKVPAGPDQSVQKRSYKAKLAGSLGEDWLTPDEAAREMEAHRQAVAHKERLLEFDRTSAQRTRVIDQASDFALPYESDDKWLDPQERARVEAERRQRLQELEERERRSNKARVITIDLEGRCIVEVKSQPAPKKPDVVEQPTNALHKVLNTAKHAKSTQTTSSLRNPILADQRPIYIAAKTSSRQPDKTSADTPLRGQIGIAAGSSRSVQKHHKFPSNTFIAPLQDTSVKPPSRDVSTEISMNVFKLRTRHRVGRIQHDNYMDMFL